MAHRASTYPLGKLLLESLQKSELSIAAFVTTVGYRNVNKGVRALDGMLRWGHPCDVFLDRLRRSPFALNEQVLQKAIKHTIVMLETQEQEAAHQRREAARVAFRPFFQAVPELPSPTQISLFVMTGGHSRYTHMLPETFPSWPLAEQHNYLAQKVPEAFKASSGRTLFMGAITGYRLFRWFEGPSLLFSVDGKPIGEDVTEPLPDATLRIGGRVLSSAQASRLLNRNYR